MPATHVLNVQMFRRSPNFVVGSRRWPIMLEWFAHSSRPRTAAPGMTLKEAVSACPSGLLTSAVIFTFGGNQGDLAYITQQLRSVESFEKRVTRGMWAMGTDWWFLREDNGPSSDTMPLHSPFSSRLDRSCKLGTQARFCRNCKV